MTRNWTISAIREKAIAGKTRGAAAAAGNSPAAAEAGLSRPRNGRRRKAATARRPRNDEAIRARSRRRRPQPEVEVPAEAEPLRGVHRDQEVAAVALPCWWGCQNHDQAVPEDRLTSFEKLSVFLFCPLRSKILIMDSNWIKTDHLHLVHSAFSQKRLTCLLGMFWANCVFWS